MSLQQSDISKDLPIPLPCKLSVTLNILYNFFGLDNWALLYAQRMALKQEVPLFVCFCLPSKFLNTTYRQYSFMIKGLQEVEKVQYYKIVMCCAVEIFLI